MYFSGTRLTDDGNELSLVHGKIDSVQDFQFIGPTYIICLYNFSIRITGSLTIR